MKKPVAAICAAIDIRAGEKVNDKALKALTRAAVELNVSKKKPGQQR